MSSQRRGLPLESLQETAGDWIGYAFAGRPAPSDPTIDPLPERIETTILDVDIGENTIRLTLKGQANDWIIDEEACPAGLSGNVLTFLNGWTITFEPSSL